MNNKNDFFECEPQHIVLEDGLRCVELSEYRKLRVQRDIYKNDLKEELEGNKTLRNIYGAKENETLSDFVERLVEERDEARKNSDAKDQYSKIVNLEAEIKELRKWKSEAMMVLSNADFQEVGKELNLPLGSDVPKNILPNIKELKKFKKELEVLQAIVLDWYGPDAIFKAEKLVGQTNS
jgi:hypothetical protein